jgi:hypothetical protein
MCKTETLTLNKKLAEVAREIMTTLEYTTGIPHTLRDSMYHTLGQIRDAISTRYVKFLGRDDDATLRRIYQDLILACGGDKLMAQQLVDLELDRKNNQWWCDD